MSRYEEGGDLLLVATDSDPQIYLPAIQLAEHCRLEIALEPHPASPSVLLRQKQALEATAEKTAGELAAALEASQAEIGRQTQALAAAAEVAAQLQSAQSRLAILDTAAGTWQRTFTDLQASFDASRAELGRALHHTEAKDAQIEALQTEIDRRRQALEEGVLSASQLQTAQTRVATLETAVATWQRTFTDLQASFDASRAELGQATHHLKVKDAQIRTLQNSVAETHTRLSQLTTELSAERSENQHHQERARALEAALQSAMEQARADSNAQRSRNQDLQAQVELDAEQIGGLEAQLRILNTALEQANAQWNLLAAELKNAQFQNGELMAQIELDSEQISAAAAEAYLLRAVVVDGRGQIARLASDLEEAQFQNRELRAQTELDAEELEQLRSESTRLSFELEAERSGHQADRVLLERSRDEAERLRGVLAIRAPKSRGAERHALQLEGRLRNTSQLIRAAGNSFKRGDSHTPAIVDLISEDIRRIHNPPFLWKMAKALGVLRFGRPGVPRTAAERRAIASGLKGGLREITQALSSPNTRPEDAATEISRLFQLRLQTRELLQALKLRNLFRRELPIWNIIYWARHKVTSVPRVALGSLFDPVWYLGKNPDVARSGADPLDHYFEWGVHEQRDPNPVFSTAWYRDNNADVAEAGLDGVSHYLLYGWKEGRDPSPLFSTSWYLTNNPDVAASGTNPLEHYLKHGALEGRDRAIGLQKRLASVANRTQRPRV